MKETLREFILNIKPEGPLVPIIVLVIVGVALISWMMLSQGLQRDAARRRLKVEPENKKSADGGSKKKQRPDKKIAGKIYKQAADLYTHTDPDNVVRLRQKLIQAGVFDPRAVGMFFVGRAILAILAFGVGYVSLDIYWPTLPITNLILLSGVIGVTGYFLPMVYINRRIRTLIAEYRAGFPDFLDLMIVCSDAGMSMEASIERISREITTQYPALARNLTMTIIELRAGRKLADALRSLSDRLELDEARAFATLLQQSKELGTSLSDTLRVFSDEMRHKRMSVAEEKAHALPAKMTVPVTVFILPVIMLVATIPVIVRFTS